jgi:hypothetical protein
MKNKNLVEILLFPKYAQANFSHKELMRGMEIMLQSAIHQQDRLIKKLILKTFKATPPIYLS